ISQVEDAVGNGTKLREVTAGVRLQKQGIELAASDVGPGALVVDYVVRSHSDVAVQVGGRLVHRHTERRRQIATIDVSIPKQSELDELDPPLDSPSEIG